MNISGISSISKSYSAYETKGRKAKTEAKKSLDKTDTFEPSSKVAPDRMTKYLDGSFLDDPSFDAQFDKLISQLGN